MPAKNLPPMELPDDLENKYVNFARISHTASEFVMDYSLLLPGVKKPEVTARLVMSPIAAKLFMRAMTENINRYEKKFGEITIPGKHTLADDLFRTPNNPEDKK